MEEARPKTQAHWLAKAPLSPFLIIGYGCYWAWTRLAFQSAVFAPRDGAFDFLCATFVVSAIANVLTVLVCILAERRLGFLRNRWGVVVAASALASLGSGMTVASSSLGGLGITALIAGSVFTGIGTGFLVLFLGECFGSLGASQVGLSTALSWVFAIGVYEVIVALPSAAAIGIGIALPLLSAAALVAATGRNAEMPPVASEPLRLKWFPRDLKVASVALFLYSVAYMVMSTLFQSGGYDAIAEFGEYSLLGGGIVALLLAVSAVLFTRKMNIGFTYRGVLPITLAGLLLVPLLGASQATVAMAVIGAGHVYLFIITWVFLSDITYRLNLPPIRVFGAAQMMFVSAAIVSVPLGRWLSHFATLGDRQWVTLPIVIALLLGTTAMLTLSEERAIGGWGLADAMAEPEEGTRPEGGAWVRKCRAIAEAHGLSARETEVMIMLAKGRSLPHIQEALHIASGTAHTHSRHIYAKLDIHSRQELLDLIERSS